jgi:endonuclease YncB( thermonuclease family)
VLAVIGCNEKPPPVPIDSGDQVQVIRATTRAHELIVAKDGKQATVRLVGIYTFSVWPREESDVSTTASLAVKRVAGEAGGRTARLELIRKELDPRGRYLGYIEVDGVDLGQRLIEEGLAAVYTEFPFSREAPYFAAERKPRTGKVGLWAGRVAAQRVAALRDTWASVRLREFDSKVADPLLAE